MILLRLAFSLLLLFGLSGCPTNDCLLTTKFSGKIVDSNGDPVTGVAIYIVFPNGDEYLTDITDINGEFEYLRGHYYGRLSDGSFSYRKIGYADYLTEPLGNGDGTCGDQIIVRNAVMVP